jgi:two-component system, sensor histidine kinase and response regulator
MTVTRARSEALQDGALTRWLLEVLDDVISFGVTLRTDLIEKAGAQEVFAIARPLIRKLVELDAVALYTLDDDGLGFSMVECDPPERAHTLRDEVTRLQDDGTFAWCLYQNRPVLVPSAGHGLVVLHSLATRAGVQGCLVGISPASFIPDVAQKLLSMAVFECASTLEIGTLYQGLSDSHRDLESKVEARTRELREALDAAQAAERAKGYFLANMSHEIRTPLAAVIGMTELLRDTRLDAVQQDYVDIVNTAGQSLLDLVDDILDFSKAAEGKLVLERLPFDLRGTLEQVVDVIAGKAQQKGLELTLLLDPSLPERVEGDPSRLRQVLLNLLSNAVKFTERGEVTLRASAAALSDDECVVRFDVRDSGIGIDPAQGAMLFTPFTQADVSTTRKYGGTGLGLAISRQIALRMHGDIGFSSELGVGSTFSVTARFPVRARPSALPADPGVHGRSAVVAAPSAATREALLVALGALGVSATLAPGEPEALLALRASAPDVIFIDHALDATALLAALDRARTAAVRLTPIAQKAVDPEGWQGAVAKPVKRAALARCVADALERRVAARESAARAQTPAVAKRFRILVADDNAVNRKLLSAMVSKLGYQVSVVPDGAQAVQAVRGDTYDLVLMDWQMPVMDGFEASQAIRELEGARAQTPIVALTANAMPGDRERCLAAGMDDYLSKPIRQDALAETLARHLPRSSTPELSPTA